MTTLSCQAYCHSFCCGHCARYNDVFMCCVSLKWACQIQIPASVKCILLFDFSTKKKLQLKFIVRLLVFLVMIWTGRMWQNGIMNLMQGRTDIHNEQRTGRPSVIVDDLVQKLNKTCCRVCDDQWSAWNDSWCVQIIGSWDHEKRFFQVLNFL